LFLLRDGATPEDRAIIDDALLAWVTVDLTGRSAAGGNSTDKIIAAIGAPAVAVVLFEVLLNATSMFNHSNAMIPLGVDRILRWFVVTPDMHRVHHSIVYNETNSNFGFNLPWWDRFFGTYRAQPAAGHQAMTIGVDAFRTREDLRLDRLLVQPFRESPGGYAINYRQ